MAPSRSERGRGRGTRFNNNQEILPLEDAEQLPEFKLHTYEVVKPPGDNVCRFLQIKAINGGVVSFILLVKEEDFELNLRQEYDRLEGRGNKGIGGVFTDDKL